jgi:hypothetical protein
VLLAEAVVALEAVVLAQVPAVLAAEAEINLVLAQQETLADTRQLKDMQVRVV